MSEGDYFRRFCLVRFRKTCYVLCHIRGGNNQSNTTIVWIGSCSTDAKELSYICTFCLTEIFVFLVLILRDYTDSDICF